MVAVSPQQACLPDGVPSFTSNQGSKGSFVGRYHPGSCWTHADKGVQLHLARLQWKYVTVCELRLPMRLTSGTHKVDYTCDTASSYNCPVPGPWLP